MNEESQPTHISIIELPSTAPQVRVTAGLGSAAQKTWNLRRPVTLIGSRRPAHIVLHDGDISHAHCVIINTGEEVLLKDLQTRTGTFCNDERIDLTLLKDGDVIAVGAAKIQVAVKASQDASDDSGCGMQYRDPLAFSPPFTLGLLHTDQRWEVPEAAVLIGRHEAARVFLDHKDVSRRHAVLFRFKNGPAVFDLCGQGGVLVNGQQTPLISLTDGDLVTVGPFGLLIGAKGEAALDVQDTSTSETAGTDSAVGASPQPAKPSASPAPNGLAGRANGEDDSEDVLEIDSKLDELRKGITTSWEQINSWQAQLIENASESGKRESDLTSRESVMQARDAEVRGRLHDVARFQEELEKRERDFAGTLAEWQKEKDELAGKSAECDKREAEVKRQGEELSRREHVFAQRWTRLVSAKCPHCGQPLGDSVGGLRGA